MVRGYIPSPRPADIIYAPIDLAVDVAEGLAQCGHEITYFGPQGTQLRYANVETLGMRPLVHNQQEFGELVNDTEKQMHYVPELWDKRFVCDMYARAKKGEFDLLYFQQSAP